MGQVTSKGNKLKRNILQAWVGAELCPRILQPAHEVVSEPGSYVVIWILSILLFSCPHVNVIHYLSASLFIFSSSVTLWGQLISCSSHCSFTSSWSSYHELASCDMSVNKSVSPAPPTDVDVIMLVLPSSDNNESNSNSWDLRLDFLETWNERKDMRTSEHGWIISRQ